jgi:hypothetical protein
MTPYEAAEILRVWQMADIGSEGIWWKVSEAASDGDRREVRLFAICSNVFDWATADLEEITRDDAGLLQSCAADLGELEKGWLPELFAARKRRMRPMRPVYREMSGEHLVALFDACGPERYPVD